MKLFKPNMSLWIFGLFALFFLGGCVSRSTVNLEPNDPRPIWGIQVADTDEAELLIQKLKLNVVKVEGSNLFIYEDQSQLQQVESLGYQIATENSYELFRRTVRINKKINEDNLHELGIKVINREPEYFIVNGTLSQLKAINRQGVIVSAIKSYEPRPRQIKVVVNNREDVAKIAALQVDIYSAKNSSHYYQEKDLYGDNINIDVYGGAFDYQIDQLKTMGYKVELLPDPLLTRKGE